MARRSHLVLSVLLSAVGLGWGQSPSGSSSSDPSSTGSSFGGSSSSNDPQPITGKQRLQWVTLSTVGPDSLAGGLVSAGFGTLRDFPREYGTHWEGFGERYGMRLTGIATSNTTEAGLGSLWGEDPRYVRFAEGSLGARLGHVVKMTFMARNRDGQFMPAYARFAAISGSNFLSNTWRADSEATASRAGVRIGLGLLGRMAGNAFQEFWPDVRQKMFSKKSAAAPAQSYVPVSASK